MARNTLDSMVRLFGSKELSEVSSFLNCAFHGARPEHIACFACFALAHQGDTPNVPPSDEAVFQSAFGDEPFDPAKLRRLKSETCRLLEDFLAIKEMRTAHHLRSELLTRALDKNTDYDLFLDTVNKRLRKLATSNQEGKYHFRELTFLYETLYYHPETERYQPNNEYFFQYVRNLDKFFALNHLEYHSENLLRANMVEVSGETPSLEIALLLGESFARSSPVFQSFLTLYKRLKDQTPNAMAFHEIRTSVFSCFPSMEPQGKKMLMKLLVSMANSLAKINQRFDPKLIHDLYKKSVEDGLSFSPNGLISPNHFLNVVITSARAEEFDWAQFFIKKYKPYLPTSESKTVELLSLASIEFQKGLKSGAIEAYRKTVTLLESIPPRSHEIYNLRIRSLTIRAYFELEKESNDLENVEKQIKNLESYLRSNANLSKSKKMEYKDFLSKLRQLCRLQTRLDTTPEMVELFLEEHASSVNAFLGGWVLQKAEELRISLLK